MADAGWQAWVWVRWKPGTPSNAWEKWQKEPLVKGAWSTIGDWDCMLWLGTNDPDKVLELLHSDHRLSEPQLHAAELALMRRAAPAESKK